jgi:hypothetical protein
MDKGSPGNLIGSFHIRRRRLSSSAGKPYRARAAVQCGLIVPSAAQISNSRQVDARKG